ncbi:MAG: hypothetical protein R3F62_05605 [Planctomycetota bacterium]
MATADVASVRAHHAAAKASQVATGPLTPSSRGRRARRCSTSAACAAGESALTITGKGGVCSAQPRTSPSSSVASQYSG